MGFIVLMIFFSELKNFKNTFMIMLQPVNLRITTISLQWLNQIP